MGEVADRMMDEAMDAADLAQTCPRGHRYVDSGWGCYSCELEAEEGEMYVYHVTVIVERLEPPLERERRVYAVKASRMALAIQRAVDYDPRVKTGHQGQNVGMIVRKVGTAADHPQESDVRPLKAAEVVR